MTTPAKADANLIIAVRHEGMFFLGSNVCDQELDTVEWTLKWISGWLNEDLPETQWRFHPILPILR